MPLLRLQTCGGRGKWRVAERTFHVPYLYSCACTCTLYLQLTLPVVLCTALWGLLGGGGGVKGVQSSECIVNATQTEQDSPISRSWRAACLREGRTDKRQPFPTRSASGDITFGTKHEAATSNIACCRHRRARF